MEQKFSWFTKFSLVMQIVGFVLLVGGILTGFYIRFIMRDSPALTLIPSQRWAFAGLAAGIGGLLFLACIVVSNIIALTLQIEQNTKVTTLLLQKLVEKSDER
jgi:di/tricarboxylate transporter